ncbi:MAG TPA: hypothetical protein VFB79_03410 [Candidatus Angelobacter sp.]|nr:hypothetical protein [Candidatus Angelobacter sp.]
MSLMVVHAGLIDVSYEDKKETENISGYLASEKRLWLLMRLTVVPSTQAHLRLIGHLPLFALMI